MINRLIIHRFRGIREGILNDFGEINLLTSLNNGDALAFLRNLLGLQEEDDAA